MKSSKGDKRQPKRGGLPFRSDQAGAHRAARAEAVTRGKGTPPLKKGK